MRTAALSALLVALPLTLQAQLAPDRLAQRRSELRDVHEHATRSGYVDAITGMLAPNGLYAGALSKHGAGRAAARAFLSEDSLNAQSRHIITVVRLDVSADGNDGYSYGYLDLVRANGDTQPGGFKAYWRRNAQGKWEALMFARGRRAPGSLTQLPEVIRTSSTVYKSWPARDTSEAWGTLQATERAFSDASAADIRAAFMSFAAPDAAKISNGSYVFGRDAIGEDFRDPPKGFRAIQWFAQWGSTAASNDIGFNVGPVTRIMDDGRTEVGGMFTTIWKRQPNGEWKYVVD